MKRIAILFLILVLLFSLSACGEKSGGQPSAPSTAPAEASNALSGETEKEEVMVYGIGEAAKANGLSITIDKVASPDPDIFINKADDGFAYMQVYYTFKNVSDETIETPKRQAIYIVYEEGPTGDDCHMTSDDNSDILPGKKEDMYRGFIELAPGESTSGWLMYQRPSDKSEVTMHYYSKFINVPPALVFGFAAP
ncbi:MAG TPA: DUF4352 domain-containing protein [Thermoanaerobacterales bacterium]|jgi:predicted small lipoprotein YifL|nr:DUF4352 domain-containing protein [Thermoanaerobacterales bacterium]